MELRLPHIIRLYNVFLESKDSDNCAQLVEEEFNKMFGIESLNDEHCRCQNRRISGRGSQTVRLRRMVIGGMGTDVLPRLGPS